MNYKETLFFVARALTISSEKQNIDSVSNLIKNNSVDWEKVVKISTKHYVFPALYCNLKKQHLLEFLPKELVNFMKDIADANRERNLQIIEQAKEINQLLKQNDIHPIFLKGSALLVQNLYQDKTERMAGDIDFIVPFSDFYKTAKILEENNYESVWKKDYSYPQFKHYDRLFHPDKIAAVEIHKELLLEEYANEFNYDIISKNTLDIDGLKVMSYENQLNLTIIAKQINDDGQYYKDIALRNAYDVFLLSQKTNSLNAIQNFKYLFNPLNNFLALCNYSFHSNIIRYKKTEFTKDAISFFNKLLENKKYRKKHYNRTKRKLAIHKRLKFVLQAFSKSENRNLMYHRVRDKEWQKEKLIQLGFKKSKS